METHDESNDEDFSSNSNSDDFSSEDGEAVMAPPSVVLAPDNAETWTAMVRSDTVHGLEHYTHSV